MNKNFSLLSSSKDPSAFDRHMSHKQHQRYHQHDSSYEIGFLKDSREYAFFGGSLMLTLGLIALVIPGSGYTLPFISLDVSYGLFIGLFPMNIVNKIILIIFGLAGLLIAISKRPKAPLWSLMWCRVIGIGAGILALLGMFPWTNSLWGFMPLFWGQILGHLTLSLLGLHFGFGLIKKFKKDK